MMSASTDEKSKVAYLEKLKEITHQIHAAEDLDDILIRIKDKILELVGAERITIYAVDRKNKQIFSKTKEGTEIREIRLPISKESIAGYIATTGQPIWVSDAYSNIELMAIHPELKFDRSWDKKTGFRTKQILGYPIMYKKYLMGVIAIYNKMAAEQFSADDRKATEEIAEVLGLAIYKEQKFSTQYTTRFDHLIYKSILTREDLQGAKDKAANKKVDTETILISEYKIPKEEILKAWRMYYQSEVVEFDDKYNISLDLLDKINLKKGSLKYLEANSWVPYKLEEDVIVVLIDDPEDTQRITDMRILLQGWKYRILPALRQDILLFIRKLSGKPMDIPAGKDIGSIITTMQEDKDEAPTGPGTEEESEMSVSEQDSGIIALANQLVVDAYKMGVSDIHVESYPGKLNTMVRFRLDGDCFIYKEIPPSFRRALIARYKIMSGLNIAERRLPQDGKIKIMIGGKAVELRTAVVPTYGGNEDVVMRILAASEPIPIEKLNLSDRNLTRYKANADKPYGLILVVGPTGSGKTTTLHSALGYINKPDLVVWTAEDPVEITQKGLRQVQVKPSIGYTFAMAMRAFLRADPDVVMIGEMRDEETASIGIEASLTGHLVFSTLHTNSAPETVTRLIDMGLDPFNFADALLCILAQRLIRTLCKTCKEAYSPTKEEYDAIVADYGAEFWAQSIKIPYAADLTLYRPKEGGCDACNKSGYKGRTGIHELLDNTDSLRKLIQQRGTVDQIRELATKEGMRTLLQDGIEKVMKGQTDYKQVKSVCIK